MEPSQPLQQTLFIFLKENCSSLFLSVMSPTTMLLFLMRMILMSKQNLPSFGRGSVWKSWQVGPCSFSTSLAIILNLPKCLPRSSILKINRFPQSSSSLAFLDLPPQIFLTGVYSSVSLDSWWLFSDFDLSLISSSMLFSRCRMRLASLRFSPSRSLVSSVCCCSCMVISASISSFAFIKIVKSISFLASLAQSSRISFLSFHQPVSSTSSKGSFSNFVLPTTTTGTTIVFSSIFISAWVANWQNSCRLSKMAWNWLGSSQQEKTPRQISSWSGFYIYAVRMSCWRLRRSRLLSPVRMSADQSFIAKIL